MISQLTNIDKETQHKIYLLSKMRNFNNQLMRYLEIVLELSKVRITFFVALTTAIGYILFKGEFNGKIILTTLAVFLLASGASALNHYQERVTDALMERTKNRPIPSGKISATGAFLVSVSLVLAGIILLAVTSNIICVVLGVFALIWYNIIYTPLKHKFALAVVPGALIGSIPPMIGWAAAGGNLLEPKIVALALFFFIWQIPHFWLLLLLYGKDYERAGFPTLTKIFNSTQLSRITFVWIVALISSSFMVPFFSISKSLVITGVILAAGILLLIDSAKILKWKNKKLYRKTFLYVNVYVLAVVILLSIDNLFLTDF